MGWVRSLVRWFFFGLCVALVVALLSEFPIEFFRQLGWFDNLPRRAADMMMAIASVTGQSWFAWLVFGVVCFTTGLWADGFMRWIEKKSPTSPERLHQLGKNIILYEKLIRRDVVRGPAGALKWEPNHEPEVDVYAEARALILQLKDIGIRSPKSPKDMPAAERVLYAANLFGNIGPLLRDGHLRLARKTAKEYFDTVPMPKGYEAIDRGGIPKTQY